jgi:excisionase family DNA binding protein
MNLLSSQEIRVSDLADYLSQLDHCLTAPELARVLGIHRITVYKLAAAGEIPSFKIATAVRFDPRAIAKWAPSDRRPTLSAPMTDRRITAVAHYQRHAARAVFMNAFCI